MCVGSKFNIRLYYLTNTFLAVALVFLIATVFEVSRGSHTKITNLLSLGHLVQLGLIALFVLYYVIRIVMPISRINEMTVAQIKHLIEIRKVLLRLVTQPDWLSKPRG